MKRFPPILACFLLVACFPASGRGQAPQFAEGISRLAAAVVSVIEKEGGKKSVVVGDFVGTPRLKAAGGPGIALQLAESLKAKGVTISDDAAYQVHGTFKMDDERRTEEDRFESVSLRIEAKVLDERDRELEILHINVFGDAPTQIAGGTGPLPAPAEGATSPQREDAKRQAIFESHAVIAGMETRPAPDSPFGIEVRVKQQARPPQLALGRAFVRIDSGEEYVVRLYNRAAFESAVTLTVDGLSMFAFSTDGSDQSQLVIPPNRFVDIPGWYIGRGTSAKFQVAGYAEGAAAAKLLPSTSVGVITATFHEAVAGSAKDPKATKLGEQIGFDYQEAKRVVKPALAVVSVRYDR